jgi:hypothetical protein
MKVAILTDLAETLSPDARQPAGIAGHEIAAAMSENARRIGRLSVDLVARRGTATEQPLVSVAPEDIGPWPEEPERHGRFLDAAYCQLILAGLLDGYDLVHCVAPLVTPLQLLAAAGSTIIQTVTTAEAEAASSLVARLLGPRALTVVTIVAGREGGLPVVPLSVDLDRYVLEPDAVRDHLLWLGSGGEPGLAIARVAARRLRIRLIAPEDGGCAPALLSQAAALVLPGAAASALDHIWAARALACGTPVVACLGSGLEEQAGDVALAPAPEPAALATVIAGCSTTADAAAARRDRVLGYHTRSAMAHRYRRIYDRAVAQRARG